MRFCRCLKCEDPTEIADARPLLSEQIELYPAHCTKCSAAVACACPGCGNPFDYVIENYCAYCGTECDQAALYRAFVAAIIAWTPVPKSWHGMPEFIASKDVRDVAKVFPIMMKLRQQGSILLESKWADVLREYGMEDALNDVTAVRNDEIKIQNLPRKPNLEPVRAR